MDKLDNSKLLRFDYDKYNPFLYHFQDVEWAIFGTLTWHDKTRRNKNAEWLRQQDFKNLVAAACASLKIRGKNLAYYRAMEWGAGECHYHFLIAKGGIQHITTEQIASTLNRLWQNDLNPYGIQRNGIGRADVRPYDQALGLAGVQYCLKREKDSYGKPLSAEQVLACSLTTKRFSLPHDSCHIRALVL